MEISTYLRTRLVPFERLLHCPAPSATRKAQSVHVPGEQVAKSVLLRGGNGDALAVLPATHRIDLELLAPILGTTELRLATEEELSLVFHDCERGALPPFGRLYGLPTIVDASLAAWTHIVVEGNVRHEALRLRFLDFEAVEQPLQARFATPICPPRRREQQVR
ncbi:MAG: YbaK/EbsC family protein [Isosphaeraceae bacterium]